MGNAYIYSLFFIKKLMIGFILVLHSTVLKDLAYISKAVI